MAYSRYKRSRTSTRARKPYRTLRRRRPLTRRRPMLSLTNRRFRKKLILGGFPREKRVVLRYVEDFTLNPGNASSAVYVFKPNSLFDPNHTSTGHQPMFHDNYAQLYKYYRVNYAVITFICCDNHKVNAAVGEGVLASGTGTITGAQYYASNEKAVRMFILKDYEVNDYPTKINTLIEEGSKNCVFKYAPQTTSATMQKLKMSISPAKFLNLPYKDDTLRGLNGGTGTGSDPSNLVYFICGVDSMPGCNADSMNFQAIITFNVTYFDFIFNQSEN